MKKLLFALLILSVPLCADSKSSKAHLHYIQKSLDKIITGVDQNVHVGVEVVSLKTGLRLYEKNAHQLFTPASNVKLFTAGAALANLGPYYRFETRLLSDGKLSQKTLQGNLYLQGTGDPSFTLNDLENLVLQLRIKQIEEIDGDIIIDHFAFDEFSEGPGWMWDDINDISFTQMNALTINHNCLDLWVKPADGVAAPPKIFAYPKTGFVTIENCALTDEKAESLTVSRSVKTKRNTIQVKGEIGLISSTKSYKIPLKGPHLYAATLLQSVLKKAGITCKGKIQIEKTPLHSETLASHRSEPLSVLLQTMMKNSDNLYADNLFKKVGQFHSKEQGTWKNGGQAVSYHLERDVDLNISNVVLLDGSGLSRYNLASPHHIASYLKWIYNEFPYQAEFLSSLSLAGRDGNLKGRFTQELPILRAKAGTMSGITCLSGYVQTADGEMLAFSIMVNGFTGKAAHYKDTVEDPICTFLANLSREK